jgi:malate dehydrogenase
MRKKVSIVGSGNVGARQPLDLRRRNWQMSFLIDIIEGFPRARAWTCSKAMPIEKRDSTCWARNDYADTANSASLRDHRRHPAQAGMSRDDLLNTNHKIMKSVVGRWCSISPTAF